MLLNHIWIPPLFTLNQASGGWSLSWLLLPLLGIAIWRWPKENSDRKRLWWMTALPLPWLILSIWTSFHWHGDGKPVPSEAGWFALASIIATVLGSFALGAYARNGRTVLAMFSIANLWLTLVGGLLCVMATSGEWI
jgi:hypothetical protein